MATAIATTPPTVRIRTLEGDKVTVGRRILAEGDEADVGHDLAVRLVGSGLAKLVGGAVPPELKVRLDEAEASHQREQRLARDRAEWDAARQAERGPFVTLEVTAAGDGQVSAGLRTFGAGERAQVNRARAIKYVAAGKALIVGSVDVALANDVRRARRDYELEHAPPPPYPLADATADMLAAGFAVPDQPEKTLASGLAPPRDPEPARTPTRRRAAAAQQ